MEKIKVLEVNNIDLPGRRFNGYDMIENLSGDFLEIKQMVVEKQSDNDNVFKVLDKDMLIGEFYRLQQVENILSVHNVFSITSPALINSKEYKEADIIHFHMFHNTKLSLYSLVEIASKKKVVLTLHDPWFLTGRCVHFYDCNKWKKGCSNCDFLNTLFSFNEDNCNSMWNLKKNIFENIDIDIVVSSKWMFDLVKGSPIFKNQKNIHLIPFGIDLKKFNSVSYKDARSYYELGKDDVVFFLRAQNEFKGTEYVLDALKKIDASKNIVIITCDNKGLLDEVKNKFRIIDLGLIDDKEMVYAMQACDVFLMPSKGESFGMMAIEAMSCGKCVVVFDNTALPSVTNAPECGYLVKNRDSHDLARAIKFLANNPVERKKRGKLGYEICKKNYDINKYNKNLKNLYKSVFVREHDSYNLYSNSSSNKELERLFNDIKNNNVKDNKYDIDYSSLSIQKEISKFNSEYYSFLFKKASNPRYFIKSKVKRIIMKIPVLKRILLK